MIEETNVTIWSSAFVSSAHHKNRSKMETTVSRLIFPVVCTTIDSATLRVNERKLEVRN